MEDCPTNHPSGAGDPVVHEFEWVFLVVAPDAAVQRRKQTYLNFFDEDKTNKDRISRKGRKGRQDRIYRKHCRGWGLCELGVLGARNFLEVVLFNILGRKLDAMA